MLLEMYQGLVQATRGWAIDNNQSLFLIAMLFSFYPDPFRSGMHRRNSNCETCKLTSINQKNWVSAIWWDANIFDSEAAVDNGCMSSMHPKLLSTKGSLLAHWNLEKLVPTVCLC